MMLLIDFYLPRYYKCSRSRYLPENPTFVPPENELVFFEPAVRSYNGAFSGLRLYRSKNDQKDQSASDDRSHSWSHFNGWHR
jgi:hypothetical protein